MGKKRAEKASMAGRFPQLEGNEEKFQSVEIEM